MHKNTHHVLQKNKSIYNNSILLLIHIAMTTITLSHPVPKSFPTTFIDLDHLRDALFQYDLESSMVRSKNALPERFTNL